MTSVFDLSWLEAVPMGILFFLGTAFALTRKRAGRALARRDFPRAVRQLGLEWSAPAGGIGLGRARGRYAGVQLLLDADEGPRVVAFLRVEGIFECRNYAHFKRSPEGYVPLRFQDRALGKRIVNAYVRDTAQVSDEDQRWLEQQLGKLLVVSERLRVLSLTAERVECRFDFGTPAFLPGALVETLVPQLVELVSGVEARSVHRENTP